MLRIKDLQAAPEAAQESFTLVNDAAVPRILTGFHVATKSAESARWQPVYRFTEQIIDAKGSLRITSGGRTSPYTLDTVSMRRPESVLNGVHQLAILDGKGSVVAQSLL